MFVQVRTYNIGAVIRKAWGPEPSLTQALMQGVGGPPKAQYPPLVILLGNTGSFSILDLGPGLMLLVRWYRPEKEIDVHTTPLTEGNTLADHIERAKDLVYGDGAHTLLVMPIDATAAIPDHLKLRYIGIGATGHCPLALFEVQDRVTVDKALDPG